MGGIQFVKRIDELLKKENKSRTDINNSLGFNRNTIAQWKQKDSIPSGDVCVKIASYLGTTVEYLVTGQESDIYKQELEKKKEILKMINELSK